MDVVYASALWYASTKVNCHFVAERLAHEHPVLFVESGGARTPRPHEWRRLLPRLLRAFRPVRRVADNLWLMSPLPLPFYRREGAFLNSRWIGLQVRLALWLRRWSVEACWIFHPMGLGTARAVRSGGVIYYCVDDHAANPGVDAATIRRMEESLVRVAALTLVTGQPLASRLAGQARRLEVLPNVADTDLFGRPALVEDHPVLHALNDLPRPRVGYIGNLATYKIDIALVADIARRRRDWSLVLVGPRNQGDVRSSMPAAGLPANVHLLGEVPHRLAPAVIDRFDVCMLPSARHDVMQASFPLKFFEYLLRGKPVVARPLPALAPFGEWFDAAVGVDAFVAAVERELTADSDARRTARREFARAFGWTERIHVLHELREVALRLGCSR